MLNILGFVAVLTNATMIAFVGSQLAEPSEVGGPNGWRTSHIYHPGSEHDGQSGMVLRWSMQVTDSPIPYNHSRAQYMED